MTTKQFAVLISTILACSMMMSVIGHAAPPQSSYIMTPAQTSLAGCVWPPAANITVANGAALCPLSLSSGPGLAIAVNGGAFVQIPMTSGSAPYTGTAPIVVNGQVISCPTCLTSAVTSLNGKTGSLTLSATATAPVVTVGAQ